MLNQTVMYSFVAIYQKLQSHYWARIKINIQMNINKAIKLTFATKAWKSLTNDKYPFYCTLMDW